MCRGKGGNVDDTLIQGGEGSDREHHLVALICLGVSQEKSHHILGVVALG
jgi:hypothetical protein